MSSPFDPIPEPSTVSLRGCLRWGCGTFVVLFLLMDVAMGLPLLQNVFTIVRLFGFGWFDYARQNLQEIPRDWFMAGIAAAIGIVGLGMTIGWGKPGGPAARVVSPKRVSLIAVVVFAWLGIAAFTSAAGSLRWWFSSRPGVMKVENPFVDRHTSARQLAPMHHAVVMFVARNDGFPVLGEPDSEGEWAESWAQKIAPFISADPGPYRWYHNPRIKLRDAAELDDCHYAGNIRVLGRPAPLTPEQISDGTAHTLLIGEVDSGFRSWRDTRNLRDPVLGIRPGPDTFSSPAIRRPGANFLFVDGHVQYLSNRVDPKVLKQLATPDGGELIPADYDKWVPE